MLEFYALFAYFVNQGPDTATTSDSVELPLPVNFTMHAVITVAELGPTIVSTTCKHSVK